MKDQLWYCHICGKQLEEETPHEFVGVYCQYCINKLRERIEDDKQ